MRFTRIGVPLLAAGGLACASESAREAEVGTAGTDSAALAATDARDGELKVAGVMIGKRLGTGNLITEPTFQFSPDDTVHVSVTTEGSGRGMLTAAWRSQSGEILQKTSEFAHTGGENTPFSLAQPKGLKPGTYKVVLLLDDDSVDTKVFVVGK
ncbi:MAG TPA: hypothetical protein VIQ27_00320 [Gemmatimonadales bacterium]|jgi:hypothetical protein